jgi:TetR/AcrR family transcriptional repressor of nem operon
MIDMEAVGRNFHLSAQNAREKLTTSAAALFQRFGYAGVSIRDITSSVDIPKGAFYNYFSSKEALASAVLSQHFDALLEPLISAGSRSPTARLRHHFEAIIPSRKTRSESPLLLICTLAAEGPALPLPLALKIAEGIRLWSDNVAGLILLSQADGQIDAKDNSDLLAAILINCWQGAAIRHKCDQSARHDCLRFALDRFLERPEAEKSKSTKRD